MTDFNSECLSRFFKTEIEDDNGIKIRLEAASAYFSEIEFIERNCILFFISKNFKYKAKFLGLADF